MIDYAGKSFVGTKNTIYMKDSNLGDYSSILLARGNVNLRPNEMCFFQTATPLLVTNTAHRLRAPVHVCKI